MDKNLQLHKIKNIGVIVNPTAGAGSEFNENIALEAIKLFKKSNIIRPEIGKGREATMSVVSDIAPEIDLILVVGGDGTMSDVAYTLFKENSTVPVLGIGAGSTNAGPLITIKASELWKLKDGFEVVETGGILASLNGKNVGLGFNDVVLGDTVLTTVDGKVVQIGAKKFMNGIKEPVTPEHAGSDISEVRIKRNGKTQVIHKGEFGQMFAAPLEERYLGKGLAGGTSLATALCLPAGIAISSEPLINFSIGADEFLEMEPVITKTASFREQDEVIVTGLRENTCLNVDGNPLAILSPEDEVKFHYIPKAARCVRI